jgi:predicted  nucleic acid-binding Zn-ribbon protein|tara:strand:- start:63 stop:266 length:204 start_codon:yes stop_codon:yes gene_type:complete
MTLAQTRERVHREIEALQDEKDTVDVQITVHNKDLVLLMERSKKLTEDLEKLTEVIPVLKDLEEAER